MATAARDVSDRRRVARERVKRHLARANKELESFSYPLSYDLRAPR